MRPNRSYFCKISGRKYGITLVMLYQSEGQLREQWGEGGKASWFKSASYVGGVLGAGGQRQKRAIEGMELEINGA